MMRAFAAWLMQSRVNAMMGAVALGALPQLDIVAGAVIALTALVQGAAEAALVALVAAAALTGGAALLGLPWPLVLLPLAAVWLTVLVQGAALRRSATLGFALQAGAAMAVAGLLAFHALHPDPMAALRALTESWVRLLQTVFGAEFPTPAPAQLEAMTRLVGGLVAASAALGASLSLLLGRWAQAALTNPGGFGREFRGFRNGRAATMVATALFVAASLADLVPLHGAALVALVPFLLQGIGVAHRLVAQRELGLGWLVAMYALTALQAPYMLTLFVGLGFADNWWNIDAGAPRAGTGKNE